jgi:ribosomal protein S18 acetylase RimI-like enzyme
MRHVLDDPAWHALTGPLAAFAIGTGAARRISPAHSFFSALDPTVEPEVGARDLAAILEPGERGVFVGVDIVVPDGFDEIGRGTARQMVLEHPDDLRRVRDAVLVRAGRGGEAPITVIDLGPSDVADMLALVDHARPGPFLDRTIELGDYVGVRVAGDLVAMAGERMRPPRHVEISAVSTHDSQRRRGLASLMVAEIAVRALARGDTPFLHVVPTNVSAIPVYEQLGFRTRRTVEFVAYVRRG